MPERETQQDPTAAPHLHKPAVQPTVGPELLLVYPMANHPQLPAPDPVCLRKVRGPAAAEVEDGEGRGRAAAAVGGRGPEGQGGEDLCIQICLRFFWSFDWLGGFKAADVESS
jgi:hypothetical protein